MLKTTKKILVLGGTGYLGQRVVHRLYQDGHKVRVMTRRPHMANAWLPHAEIVTGDALSGDDLLMAMREGVSHIVVCIRLWETLKPKAYANMALHILHTANRVGIQHLTWVAEIRPDMHALRKTLRTQKGHVQVFFLQSGPIIGSGSLAKTAQSRLAKYPRWIQLTHGGQALVAINQVVTTMSRAIAENKAGHILMSSPSPRRPDKTPEKNVFKNIRNTLSKRLWLWATRLPHKLGPWLYLQMEGPASQTITFTPDTYITWQEAIPDHHKTTWNAISYPCTPKIQTWLARKFAGRAQPKPGQYHRHFRLIYSYETTQVWQSRMSYPFGLRIVLAETPHVVLLPAGGLGWGIGTIGRLLWGMTM